MMTEELNKRLKEITGGEVMFDEPLVNHSTIRVGGRAIAFAQPKSFDQLAALIKIVKDEDVPHFILGAGSNVLFRDNGFDGVVINTSHLNSFTVKQKTDDGLLIEAGAGVFIGNLVELSLAEGVCGFEYLAGIPGTVGGALSMNAGTHDGVISDPLLVVRAIDKSGRPFEWPKDKIEFSYRKAKYPRSCVITSADFYLKKGSKEEIEKKISTLKERRKLRHPLGYPSLGSIFKNPAKGPSAGELIEEAGLKGIRVGGARVANEHANWIVNEANATAKDILVLVQLVREKVKESSDILLETEIIVVGNK